ncbi:MAG: glycosyltransferase [candidate division Zixibacteria bacterium]|nr:glycosyltransferase [candidate division Zixibacteria bacterium]
MTSANTADRTITANPLRRMMNFLRPARLDIAATAQMNLKNHRDLSGQDIMTLSTQDWLDLWTRKQRFVLQFARQGNRVIYVETQFHWLSYIKQLKKHWRRIYLFLYGPRKVEENLYVYTPPLLLPAFQIFPSLATINNFALAFFLKRAMRRVGMRNPVLWCYTHFNKPLIKKLGCKRALYECVDDYAGSKGLIKAEVVRKQEAQTLKSVNAAIVTADGLKPPLVKHNRNVHTVSNAANVSHFNRAVTEKFTEPDDLKQVPRPRLVFLGTTAYWVDLDLLEYVATVRPSWQILLIGPVTVDVSRFDDIRNFHCLGRKSYDDLPGYMAYCDVALNPYVVDDVARGCSPLKLYEYLAAGMPVVSTEMPEARKFERIVAVATSYEQYVAEIDRILARDAQTRTNYQLMALEESRQHSWENRFLQVEKIAMEALK